MPPALDQGLGNQIYLEALHWPLTSQSNPKNICGVLTCKQGCPRHLYMVLTEWVENYVGSCLYACIYTCLALPLCVLLFSALQKVQGYSGTYSVEITVDMGLLVVVEGTF